MIPVSKILISLILLTLACGRVYSQYEIQSESYYREMNYSSAIDAAKKIRDLIPLLNNPANYVSALLDSGINSKKTVDDYKLEQSYKEFGNGNLGYTDLGYGLQYKEHYLRNIHVEWVTWNDDMIKVQFVFLFDEITDSVVNIIRELSGNLLEVSNEYMFYERIYSETVSKFRREHPEIILEEKYSDTGYVAGDFNYINDPVNHLDYGFACDDAGAPPRGLTYFAYLVHCRNIYRIEKLLYSPNPVARLYAFDAVNYLSSKGVYSPSVKIEKRLIDISNEDTIIQTCDGCFYSIKTISGSIRHFRESAENPYTNISFSK